MYSTKYSILFLCVIFSLGKSSCLRFLSDSWLNNLVHFLVLLWCTNADSSEQQEHALETSNEDFDDLLDVYRRASLRPVVVHQRASLRPVSGKRASLRPVGRRASLRPFSKRASLPPPTYYIN